MMEQEWPGEVLRLPKCKEVKGPDDSLIFRGPRIRMGAHWALEGTVAQRWGGWLGAKGPCRTPM